MNRNDNLTNTIISTIFQSTINVYINYLATIRDHGVSVCSSVAASSPNVSPTPPPTVDVFFRSKTSGAPFRNPLNWVSMAEIFLCLLYPNLLLRMINSINPNWRPTDNASYQWTWLQKQTHLYNPSWEPSPVAANISETSCSKICNRSGRV